ncbi:SAM-dependent methyltransferase [Mycolicibacterium sp. PAM1]|uniref:HsdM family class I SAM-dependent methyltransferase n=1 Tax=Mycolicibacterium sp. PAM1 TaxID=2853535 RepID=UPI001C3CB49A|nr:N-6 DNA methylase [Mycolicibacterium sp. PAM1]MBV5247030.1 SAM-dependent methyltransferase [Mycolicibacterium sp. PAM1]
MDAGLGDQAYALIEVKEPEDWKGPEDRRIRSQLFALTGEDVEAEVLSLATVEVGAGGSVSLRSVTIAREPGLTYQKWRRRQSPYIDAFPVNYGEPTAEPLKYKGKRDLNTEITRAQLDRVRVELHNKLWGGSRDDNQIYAWLVRIFLTKIFDEKHTARNKPYQLQVLYEGSQRENAEATFARVNKAYQEAYARYIDGQSPRDEGLSGPLFSASELQWVVETLQEISLTSVAAASGDLLGGFFEGITRDGFKQSKGLFFTHYNVAVFMLDVLDLGELALDKLSSAAHTNDRLPYIIDPSCGSGTFLLAAMRLITTRIVGLRSDDITADLRDQLDSKFPEGRPNEWAKDYLYGIEKREDLTISTKVNMVLHKDGNTHIFNDDGLRALNQLSDIHGESRFRALTNPVSYYTKPRTESFDVLISNPPFSISLDSDVQSELNDNFELADASNSENLFVERWYQLLRPGGRLAAVLPESFYSTSENVAARLFVLRHFNIRAIVSLPVHTFAPWTPTRTSLLFAAKKTPADEVAWSTKFDMLLGERLEAQKKGLASARKLKRPGRASAAQLKQQRSQLKRSLAALGIDSVAVSASMTEGDLDLGIAALQATQVEADALKETVAELSPAPYHALVVDEVGYRRTKRAENAAPNDLFEAYEAEEGNAQGFGRRLLNLNDAKDGWNVKLVEDGSDALSILKSARIWE